MKKAFTITELLVAVGLLAVVLAACGIIFNYSIDAQRTAGATAEIMRNLRVITDQLNADFAGYIGPPFYFGTESAGDVNAFSIAFLTTGDFQTANMYLNGTKTEPVRGNIAIIYYGQSGAFSGGCPDPLLQKDEDRRNKILTRKQVILAPAMPPPTVDGYEEYDNISLAEIQKNCLPPNEGYYQTAWVGPGTRPVIDVGTQASIKMYLVRGVDNFWVAYCDTDDRFNADKSINWKPPTGVVAPSALKFTFTLYDSKGIIKAGKRFEHIVYIKK